MIMENLQLPKEAPATELMAIDSSSTLLKVYERTLAASRELRGIRLVPFTSGRIALEWLEQNPNRRPALMLLDRNMEGFSGLQMLLKLKADERWKDISVIMASTTGEHAQVVEAIKGGASDYIVKPLQSGVLAAKLMKVLSAREMSRTKRN